MKLSIQKPFVTTMNRIAKTKLLTTLMTGTATAKQIADLRESQEPLYLTLNLGDDENPYEPDPDEPTYHIDIFDNWKKTIRYFKYPDGRIEEVN